MAKHANRGIIISKDPKVLEVKHHDTSDPLYKQTQYIHYADYTGNFEKGEEVGFDWNYHSGDTHPFFADALKK